MTANDFFFAMPTLPDIRKGNLAKTLPDIDANGSFHIPRFCDVTRIVESYGQLQWHFYTDSSQLRPRYEWSYITNNYSVTKQHYEYELFDALTRTYLPLLGFENNVNACWYFDYDPFDRFAEKTPTVSNNFANCPNLLERNFADFNFGMGYYTAESMKDIWEFTL